MCINTLKLNANFIWICIGKLCDDTEKNEKKRQTSDGEDVNMKEDDPWVLKGVYMMNNLHDMQGMVILRKI